MGESKSSVDDYTHTRWFDSDYQKFLRKRRRRMKQSEAYELGVKTAQGPVPGRPQHANYANLSATAEADSRLRRLRDYMANPPSALSGLSPSELSGVATQTNVLNPSSLSKLTPSQQVHYSRARQGITTPALPTGLGYTLGQGIKNIGRMLTTSPFRPSVAGGAPGIAYNKRF